jgi:hypothetical protein
MISGGIKFFDRSKCLLNDNSTITATSGSAAADRMIDRNLYSYWQSVGSNDTVTETVIVTMPTPTAITRILLVDHNFKAFTLKWDNAGAWAQFSGVVGLDGALGGGITESAFVDNTAYYEFAQVTTTKIQLTVTSTQVANSEKRINQIIATTELGTLSGYPDVDALELSRKLRTNETLSGRLFVAKADESMSVNLKFAKYPARAPYGSDIDLMFALDDREVDFLIWLCGGKRGSAAFTYQLRGWRLKDVYPVQVSKAIKPDYEKNIYVNTINMTMSFAEVP